MLSNDLVSRVAHQLDVARNTVRELEYIRDQLVNLQAERGIIEKSDHIPGIGTMRRSNVYMAALKVGTRRAQPSYLDESGEIWYLYRAPEYMSTARKLGVGRQGIDLVMLNITEHAKVRRAIRKERRK